MDSFTTFPTPDQEPAMDSNHTLRFPRTYREATGQDAHFERRDPDKLVGWAIALLLAFTIGLIVGGAP